MSVALLLAANYAVAGRLAWTPGGSAIPFGRMLQAGIVARYLAEHCPDPRLPKLCANRDKLPTDTDFFFWGSDLFDELGRFEGLGEEMRLVVRESLTAYPADAAQGRDRRHRRAARARRDRLWRAHRDLAHALDHRDVRAARRSPP